MLKKNVVKLSPPQFLTVVFFCFILIGTAFLKIPVATFEGISWVDALFTATSAMTVTGLTSVDTEMTFTLFGQIVIIVLIQVGGLGIMSFAVLLYMLLGKKIGFKQRMLIQEALNQGSIGGMVLLVKRLFIFSLSIELFAMIVLSLRWGPELGWKQGIYAAFFHSISAFNNAGFSIWSNNLMDYVTDPVINLVISFLFIVGGIGFTVLADLWYKKQFKELSLHTKLMLVGTLVINVMAVLLVLILEYNNPKTLGPMTGFGKVLAAYFQGVVTRTAGFNTVDIGGLEESTQFLMTLLMFIGAGSASTGGGIKLTTFIAIILAAVMYLKRKEEMVVFNRSIRTNTIIKSLAIALISGLLIFTAVFLLELTEDAPFLMIWFEVVSAFGTVGLSMGLTPDLTTAGKLILAVVMFAGKLGPLTLAFSLSRPDKAIIRYPKGDIMTG